MTDYREYAYQLENLQNTLDAYRRQRGWLAISWVTCILLGLILISSQLIQGFSIVLMALLLAPLLPLIILTHRHLQVGAALEAEVRSLPYRELAGEFDSEKPKNHQTIEEEAAPYFTIGDDGELVELPPEMQRKKS